MEPVMTYRDLLEPLAAGGSAGATQRADGFAPPLPGHSCARRSQASSMAMSIRMTAVISSAPRAGARPVSARSPPPLADRRHRSTPRIPGPIAPSSPAAPGSTPRRAGPARRTGDKSRRPATDAVTPVAVIPAQGPYQQRSAGAQAGPCVADSSPSFPWASRHPLERSQPRA